MTSRLRCVRRGSWVALTALTIGWSPGASVVRAQASPPTTSPGAPADARPPSASLPPPPPAASGSASAEGGAPVAPQPASTPGDACVADRFISLESENLAPDLAAEVRTDFATELRHRGLDVCDPASAARDPAALVRVEGRDDLAIIELDDRVTHKRVARDLSLRGIPANGRALAIAIAIDELLRASWAELTLTRRRADQGDDTDALEDDTEDGYVPLRRGSINARAGNARRRAHPPTRYQVGVDLGYLHTQDRFDAFSLGARAAVRPWGLGWFELGVAGLAALPASSPLGDVMAAGLRSTLTAGVCSRQDKPAHGCAGARGGVSLLSFRGLHPEMASARSDLGLVVDTSLLVQLGARLSSTLTLFTDLGVGAVLQGAKATDGLDTVLGVTGLLLSANLGLGFDL